MDKQKKQMVIAGVLAVVLIGVILYNFVLAGGPPENYQLPPQVTGAAAAPAATGTPAAAPAAPAGGVAPTAQIAADEIDIDQLTQSVNKVSFDYDAVRIARNPMTPLVGRTQRGAEGEVATGGSALVQRARSMLLTGIIWNSSDPLAILDNAVVSPGFVFNEGDSGGIVVDTIEPNRVILRVEDQIIPLNLEEQ